MEWKPIETAPKDLTRILVPFKGKVYIAYWDDEKYAREPRPFWFIRDQPFGKKANRLAQPLVWMPLPDPPVLS